MVGGGGETSSRSTAQWGEGNCDDETQEWLGEGERRDHSIMVGRGGETSSGSTAQWGEGNRDDETQEWLDREVRVGEGDITLGSTVQSGNRAPQRQRRRGQRQTRDVPLLTVDSERG